MWIRRCSVAPLGLIAALCMVSASLASCTVPPRNGPPPRGLMAGPLGAGAPPVVAHPPEPPTIFRDGGRRQKVETAVAGLDGWLASEQTRRGLPGVALGVVVDDALVFSKGYGARDDKGGAIDADTVFRIGSITKVFTAMMALGLREEGKLRFDDPASAHLPELSRLLYPVGDLQPITVRQLLTHTAGLPRLGAVDYTTTVAPEPQKVLAGLDGLQLDADLGTTPRYSNLGMTLLGLLLAQTSGVPYREWIDSRLLRPLEMTATVWEAEAVPTARLATAHDEAGRALPPSAHWHMGPAEAAGGLYSSVRDLARFAALQLAAWPPRSGPEAPPLRRASLREAQTLAAFEELDVHRIAAVDGGSGGLLVAARGTGLGWQVERACDLDDLVWHNGGTEGYRSALFMLPRLGVAVIALSNGSKEVSSLARELLNRVVDEAVLQPRVAQPAPALETALKEVASLLELGNINEPRYVELFDDAFRRQVSLQDLRELVTNLRARRGGCAVETLLETVTPRHGRWRFSCQDRSALTVEIALGQTSPARITALSMKPAGDTPPPSKPTSRCAGL